MAGDATPEPFNFLCEGTNTIRGYWPYENGLMKEAQHDY
jgi:hypothetical protein